MQKRDSIPHWGVNVDIESCYLFFFFQEMCWQFINIGSFFNDLWRQIKPYSLGVPSMWMN